MADRTVVYRLMVEASQFKAQMAAAGQAAQQTGQQIDTGVSRGAGRASKALDLLGVSAVGAAAMVGVKVVTAAADFEQAMSGVQAATHESASNMEALRDAALSAGAQTAFSATEAAAGIENLAKAGISTQDILGGGLAGALDLAAAGQLGVADASEIAATALTQFKLSGEDVPHVADLLAAGAGKAQGEVTDLAQALKQSGLVASQMGLSVEETTGTLAAFAEAGLLGSDAGTSFRTMLLRMANPTKQSADLMAQLGINAYDANGAFVGMESLAGQLQTAFEGKTQAERDSAMATIFGSDAIRAAAVLYENGSEGVAGWTDKVNDAGYAAGTAAIQMDNLRGDVEELQGALETAFIQEGSEDLGGLRGLTQLTTNVINLTTEAENAGGALGGLWDSAQDALNPLGKLSAHASVVTGKLSDQSEATEEVEQAQKSTATTTGQLSASTSTLADQMRLSAKEIEAQEKALKEAREAASDTASAFVGLGDSFTDAKVSLRNWIRDMAEQADALANFTTNAERAANHGLRQGLIAAMAEAGPEGAFRMKQLANATDEEIARANRAWKRGQAEMQRWVDFAVPAKKIEVNDDEAISAIRAVRREIDSVQGKTVVIRVHRENSGKGPLLPDDYASGGYTGSGGKYEPAGIVHRGEVVIPQELVSRDWSMLSSRYGHLPGFAEGGKVGSFKGEDREEARAEARAEARHRREMEWLSGMERATSDWLGVIEGQRDEWASIADGLQSSMDAIGAAAVAGFNSDLFGVEQAQTAPWGQPVASDGMPGWMSALTGDTEGLEERNRLIAQLSAAGLDGDALGAALEQASNAELQNLLDSGQVQIFEDMYRRRAELSASVSAAAGQAAFGAEYVAATQQVANFAGQVADLTREIAQLQEAQNPTSPAARRGYREQAELIGAEVRDGVVNGFQQVARRG